MTFQLTQLVLKMGKNKNRNKDKHEYMEVVLI